MSKPSWSAGIWSEGTVVATASFENSLATTLSIGNTNLSPAFP